MLFVVGGCTVFTFYCSTYKKLKIEEYGEQNMSKAQLAHTAVERAERYGAKAKGTVTAQGHVVVSLLTKTMIRAHASR